MGFIVSLEEFLGLGLVCLESTPAILIARRISLCGILGESAMGVRLRVPFDGFRIVLLHAAAFIIHVGERTFRRTIASLGPLGHIGNSLCHVFLYTLSCLVECA